MLVARTGNLAKDVPVGVTADANYVIGPEDMLDISVWKEPELTRTVPVRPDGKISLPLLNDVQAAGQTPTQLATHVKESLTEICHRSPGDGDRHSDQQSAHLPSW